MPGAGGYTYHGRPQIFLSPNVCAGLTVTPSTPFGPAINTLLHEAYTHYGSGTRDQGIQECGARLLIYEALRRFWGVPSFSATMYQVTQQALAYSFSKPAAYQGGCDRL